MRSTFITLAAVTAAGSAYAQSSAYGQCGGTGWSGSTTCVSGYSCQRQSDYYYQCLPGTATTTRGSTTTSKAGGSTPTSGGGSGSGSGRVSYAGTNVSRLSIDLLRTQLTKVAGNRSQVLTLAALSTAPARHQVLPTPDRQASTR
jgi:hypothetical protein